MPFALAAKWWSFALRGALAALFGLVTVAGPELPLATFALLFAWYAFAEGGFNALAALRATRANERWGPLLLEGLVSVGVGVMLFSLPGLSWHVMLTLVALWGLSTGAFELVAGARLCKRIEGEWLLNLAGVASLALGTVLALASSPDPLKAVFWLGVYALAFGGLLLALGLRLRGYNTDRAQATLGPPFAGP